MRKFLLLGAMCAAPHLANAAVITEIGLESVLGQDYYGYQILYSFPPITSIPGQITSVQVSFSGYVIPEVCCAYYSNGGTISSLTVTPAVYFGNEDLPGAANAILVYSSVVGAPETLAYNNTSNSSYGAIGQELTFSAIAGAIQPNVFAAPSVEEVTFVIREVTCVCSQGVVFSPKKSAVQRAMAP